MNMQGLIVLVVVSTAAAFLARRVWRSVQAARKPKGGCTDCGCGE
jgi:hypothetical protein